MTASDLVDPAAPAPVDADESTAGGGAALPALPGAAIVAALEGVWTAIQGRHPEVPDVMLIIGQGAKGGKSPLKFGHFADTCWHGRDPDEAETEKPDALHEVFIGGEGLARTAVEVVGTLLHEASHAVAAVREIKDTSRGGRYHNEKFKDIATELGIVVTRDARIGWSPTTVPEETAAVYAEPIAALAAVLAHYRGTRGKPSRPTAPPLACACDRKIRASKKVLDQGPIMCGTCGEQFEPVKQ